MVFLIKIVVRWWPPTEVISNKLQDVGNNILGRAVEVLPVGEKIKEEIVSRETQTQETSEKTEILEAKTKGIIEVLKELPEEQFKQIKKQVFKDFCEKVMGD